MRSWVQRLMSVVLVLILAVTGVYIPFVSYASAEGSAGGNQVSDTPDSLLSMGEWQYWVEDGTAIIAGYTNYDETALTVPYELGGYPVAGIGHHAFSQNYGLKSITIHTNVTLIANDAFHGVNGITISAYHGAYALEFARNHNLNSECIENRYVTLAENVIDMAGVSTKAYSNLTEYSVVFDAKQATFLKSSQILYFSPTKAFPAGLARKVSAISVSGESITASLSVVEMGEALEAATGETDLYLDWDNAIYPEWVTSVTDVSSEGILYDYYDGTVRQKKYKKELGIEIKLGDGFSVEGKATFNVEAKASYVIRRILLFHWSLKQAEVTAKVDTDVSLALKFQGKPLGDKKRYVNLSGKYHKTSEISIPFFSAYGFTGYVTIELINEINGSFSLVYNDVTIHKYTLRNGDWHHSSEKLTHGLKEGSAEGSIKVGPKVSLQIDLGIAGLADFTIFDFSLSLYAEGKGSLKAIAVTGAVSTFQCAEITLGIYFEIKVKVGIVKFKSKIGRMEFEIGACLVLPSGNKGKIPIIPPFTLHWDKEIVDSSSIKSIFSGMKKVDKCWLKGRRVVFDPKNGSGGFEQIHDVNTLMNEPSRPTRKGYRFNGWYVDAKKSGFKGDDYYFNFSKMKMPYVANNGALYLYGTWIDLYPVKSIKLNKTSIVGYSNVGTTEKLTVTEILPTNANNKAVKWSSTNSNVASVDQNGNVKLKNAGKATIKCTSVGNPSTYTECSVEVKQSVTGIQMSPSNVFRYSDNMSGFQITPTVLPADAANKAVIWTSSNTSVATVSDTGYVTLKGLGTATITCKSVQNPQVTGKCTIAVRQAVTGITLNKESELRTNANMSPLQLVATVAPANAFNKAVTWTSSNTKVATVSANGLVSMKGVGETIITCTSVSNPNKSATFHLTIIQAVTDILLNEKSVTRYSNQTEPIQLTAEILPANAGNKAITWTSSDPDVVTVDQNGLVSIVGTKNQKEAHAVVTCRSVSNPDVAAECRFTVLQAVTGIELNQTSITTSNDEVNPAYLSATVSPAYAYNKAITWTSSNPAVATVTNDGIVVFKGLGQTTITCASVSTPAVTATCTVNVTEAITGLHLSESSIVRYSNQTEGVQLIATLDAAPVSDRELTWTTDNASVATVSESGIVHTHGIGSATVTCTSNSNPDVSAECLVIVRQSVTSIVLNETAIVRDSDNLGTVQLTATVAPSTAVNRDIVWESSELAVATVDDSGLVSLVGPGNATITCRSISDPEICATCAVTVHQAVTSIRLNIAELTRYSSDTSDVQLLAYCYPSYAYNNDVTWESSNTDVVTVSQNGAVNVTGAGTATITCRCVSKPNLTATCSVNILQAVESITLNKRTLSLYSDRTSAYSLTATISPDNAENKAVIWTSSNTDVVNVSDGGQLVVAGAGKATVTCRAVSNPNAYATCTVTVKQAVQSIVLNESELVCYADDTAEYQLIASVQPAHADNKGITWESSDPDVVTVADDGVVTIVGVGSAVITCTSKVKTSVSAQCSVTVKQPMTSITLNQTSAEMYSDDEEGIQLTATILPDDTDDTDVIWETDNLYVAMVSDTGLVEPVAKGTAHITCRSARRPEEVYATCTVEVKQKVEGIDIEGDTASLLPGETVQLIANRYPDIADNKDVTWSSDNPGAATVDQNGLVTAVNYGTAVITATSTDGSDISATYVITVEHELVLETVTENDTLYAQGNYEATIATVGLGNASARRMAEAGYDVNWSLTKPDDNDDVDIHILTATVSDRGEEYETTYALLSGSHVGAVGSRTYTVTCAAGPYTESVNITIDVINTEIPESVVLDPSTFTARIGEAISISNNLSSGDGKPVPSGLEIISISGDEYFINDSTVNIGDSGYEIAFSESGIYNATIYYTVNNVAYDVNVSFYIQDEDGTVHIRTESIELDESYLVLIEDTTRQLNYTATPLDAYDTSVTWSSSDETVALVDQSGVVTAVSPGIASIACTANDDRGATAICVIEVERFLQLDDTGLDYTVYTGGEDHANLGIVNVTIDSERRLTDAGLNVTWSLEKMDGTACDIAVEEFRAEAEECITVSGNRIKLLRIHEAGTDQYRLTCKAGEYTASCDISIQVIDAELPAAVSLAQTEYFGTVNEIITIDTTYTPAVLPEGTRTSISGGNAFENALSDQYDFREPEKVIFEAPGTFAAKVVFSGDNYTYTCPITIVVSDENGNVPVNITDIRINPESLNLLVGEQATLTCEAEPADATFSRTVWTSSDTGIATVSSNGRVTAIGAGIAFISVSVPESDFVGGCMVVVEDGLTLRETGIERTVFVDGITRTQLDTVQLTASSSQRLAKAPEWSLTRKNGNNLTLKVKEYNTSDTNGDLIYGCSIVLYSLSREGDTEYELTCTAGDETVTIPITIHAVNRSQDIPSGLTLAQSTFTASVNELIQIVPDIVCLPSDAKLPDGMRVTLEGNALFNNSVNTDDYLVSQNMTAISFNRAGLFEANYIYSYSNMRYIVPVTFRIMDETGAVPILATTVSLSSRSLWLTEGETATLSAVFTPADADNKAVTWTSTDPSVVTVDNHGNVTAVGKGQAEIICQPAETYLSGMICPVWVEDYLSWETGGDHITLYKQGQQVNEVFSAVLSEGTKARLSKAGITPEWSLTRVNGTHSDVVSTVSDQGDSIIITSAMLNSNGSDEYCLTCTAGEYMKSANFTVEVIDAADIAETITLSRKQVSVAVGETITIDFTPVCEPAGSRMPQSDSMWDLFAGLGNGFHDAVDYDVYAENGDTVTIRFTKPGRYLLSHQYFLDNLHYRQVCEITVGQASGQFRLLQADTTDAIVYIGGTAGAAARVNVSDALMLDVFDGNISWALSHVSGDSMDAVLKETGNGVELLTVATDHPGEDTWRVTCTFGDYSEYVDIHVDVREPRSDVPETVELSLNRISGMTGDWLSMPIAVSCTPAGSALPETGDDFWQFTPMGLAADVCEWEIEDGLLRVQFRWPGYYTGILAYEAGNFKYSMPVYMVITDEEGVLASPDMEIYLLNMPESIYADGEANATIGTAELSHGIGSYYAGEADAYMNEHENEWSISITNGDAATLGIEKADNHSARITVSSIRNPGTITYRISCTVEGENYSRTGELTVLEASADRPDPALQHSVYYAATGEKLTIPTALYDQGSGTILQGTAKWIPDTILSAIGYEYIEKNDCLQMTFYKEGTFYSVLRVTIGNLTYDIPFTIIVSNTPVVHRNVLKLPSALTEIEDNAFEGTSANVADLRGTRVTRIGAGAFSRCTELEAIYIPSTVTSIGTNAFYGCLNLTIICEQGSAADDYAGQHNIPVRYE